MPRVAGKARHIDEVLLEDVVELTVLHRHRDRGIDRIDVRRLPRGLAAEKDVLELHLRDDFAAMKDQIVERPRADAGCELRWLRPPTFGQRTVVVVAAFSLRARPGLNTHRLRSVGSV